METVWDVASFAGSGDGGGGSEGGDEDTASRSHIYVQNGEEY